MGKYTLEALEALRKTRKLTHNEQGVLWCLRNPERAKELQRASTARYRLRHPEKVKENTIKSKIKNANRVKAGLKAWREKNVAHLREYEREYREKIGNAKRRARYAANPEHDRERRREWNRKNPEWCRANKQKRRAMKLAAGGTFTKAEIQALLIAQDYRCANPYCAADLRVARKHLDHIEALTRGGANDVTNLQWLCEPCNQRKTNFPVAAWLAREAARCQAHTSALQEA